MCNYENLESILKERGVGKTDLVVKLGISSKTIAKISKGEKPVLPVFLGLKT